MRLRKPVSVLLALAMLLGVFAAAPMVVRAAYDYKQIGDWIYYERAGEYFISDYVGNKDAVELTIPSTLNGNPINWITIDFTSENFPNLQSIRMPANIAITEMPFFRGNSTFRSVKLYDSGGVQGADNKLPDSVTKLRGYTFEGTSIVDLDLNNVTEVGPNCFTNCDSLRTVTFHHFASVDASFRYIDSTCTVNYQGGRNDWDFNDFYCSPNLLVKCGDGSCGWCGGNATGTNNTMQWSMDQNGNLKITNHTDLYMDFPDQQLISTHRWDKSAVRSIDVERVWQLSENEFKGCSKVESVTLHEGLNAIGDSAFEGCNRFTTLNIPTTVTSIGENAFLNCSSLKDTYFNDTKEKWEAVTKGSDWNSGTAADFKAHYRCTVTVTAGEGGTAWADVTNPYNGDTVHLSANHDSGYRHAGWTVLSGGATVTGNEFVQPDDHVEIQANFAEVIDSSYTLVLPDEIVITPYNNFTTVNLPLTQLDFQPNEENKAPERIQMGRYAGTLVNAETGSEIPFTLCPPGTNVSQTDNWGAASKPGTMSFCIRIESAAWNAAAPGLYTGDLNYILRWVYYNPQRFVKITEGSVPVKVTVPEPTYPVTVTADPAEGGTVTGAGAYEESTTVTLSATPNTGYRFVEWQVVSDNVSIENNQFTMPAEAVEIKAVFAILPRAVTVNVIGGGIASSDPQSSYESGIVTLSATADEGWRFKEWQVVSGGVTIENNAFTMGPTDVEINAVFEAIYDITTDGNCTIYSYDAQSTVTVAAEGERLKLVPDAAAMPDEGRYFTGEFSVNCAVFGAQSRTPLTPALCDFTMSGEPITVALVQKAREALIVDLIGGNPVEITEDAYITLLNDNRIDKAFTGSTGNVLLDLDGSGIFDAKMYQSEEAAGAGSVTRCYVVRQKVADAADAFAYAYADPQMRYLSITLALIDREALVIDLSAGEPVEITEEAYATLLNDDRLDMAYIGSSHTYLIDLDGSGIFDAKMYQTEEVTDEGSVTHCFVAPQKVADAADRYTYAYDDPLMRYLSITFSFTVPENRLRGDTDGNDKVDVFDASYIQKAIAGVNGYPNFNALDRNSVEFRVADVDGNGKVDVFDASLIQKHIAGSSSAKPYGIGEAV